MYKFLTSKKGFTLVELMIVLVLLSLGIVALGNLFTAAYRSYNKSEERYLKQEAVKTVANLLRTGSTGVAAAQKADVFPTAEVVPSGSEPDKSNSYLFAKAHLDDSGNVDGYYISVLDKGKPYSEAKQLSNTPIYISIKVMADADGDGNPDPVLPENPADIEKYYNGVYVTLAALEDDYDYSSGEEPTSDDIYYSLDVAYHFPNMATSNSGALINHIAPEKLTTASKYTESGTKATGEGSSVEATPEGIVLRVYCDSILSGSANESEISAPSMCFIATASYGEKSGEVGMLCDFRDKILLTNPLGEAFVKAYYKISPPIADFIAESEPLKAAVRLALKPLIVVAEYALNEEIQPIGAGSLAVFMLCGLGATVVFVRVDKRKIKN